VSESVANSASEGVTPVSESVVNGALEGVHKPANASYLSSARAQS